MASAIFFNGRRINIPQAVARIDASALASVSPAAVGIVALIGTAEGGEPLTVDEAVSDFTTPEALASAFRSGDLKVNGAFCFEPSADDAVPGGAQRIVTVKVNPATRSSATLSDALAADSADLLSEDFGQFTEQINIEVAAGTTLGKLITIVFEDITEVFDDVGGVAIFTNIYAPGADGWDTMTGAITAAAFTAVASRSDTGLDADIAADILATGVVRVVSSDAGDTARSITVYGIDGAGAPVFETIALDPADSTTPVDGTQLFDSIFGSELDAAAIGTVTLSDAVIPTTILTFSPGTTTRGVIIATNMPVDIAGFLTVDADAAAVGNFAYLFGENASGASVAEEFDMTAGTPVLATQVFRKITRVVLGDVAAARTITITGNAEVSGSSVFTTVQRLVDRLNTLDGFTANSVVSNPTTFLITDADYAPAQSMLATASFFADLFFFIKAINDGSQFMTALRASGAVAVPANTTSPVFLAGGVEGVPTITEFGTAFTLLQKRRVNIIVPLSRDPAVHALLLSHLVARAGRLARIAGEANGYVGLGTSGGAGATLSTIKTEIIALQTRHISAISQEVSRFAADTGEATFFPPFTLAAISAGMQAGSAIAEPLTRKRPIALDLRNDASWSVEDNASDLIDAGLMMYEKVDNVGIRCIRSITTHLADDNIVFVEMSANESANTAIFELRRRLELKIGQRGLASSVATIKALAFSILGQIIDDEIIVAFRSLQVEQIGDVFPVSVELAPVLPINFIPVTVHLVAVRVAA